MGGPQETSWGKVGAVAGVVAAILAVVGIAIAHNDSRAGGNGSPAPAPSFTPQPATSLTPQPVSLPAEPAQAAPTYQPSSPSGQPGQASPPAQVRPTESPNPPSNVISAVYVTATSGNGLILKKGAAYELQPTYPSDINPPYMTFRWASQGAGGEIGSGDCDVSATITGPGEYPQQRHDGGCSGRVGRDLKIMVPGVYTISVEVTPPGGGAPVSGSTSFTVVPHGG